MDIIENTADTIGITIEADTGLTDDEFKREFQHEIEVLMAGMKNYRINKYIEGGNVKSRVKWVNRTGLIANLSFINKSIYQFTLKAYIWCGELFI